MFVRLFPTDKSDSHTLSSSNDWLTSGRLIYVPIEKKHIQKLQQLFSSSTKHNDKEEKSAKQTVHSMGLFPKSLAGPGYIILNGIRVLNVIGFLAVITASIGMLVKTSTNSRFFFFDAVSHVFTTITGMFLLISELTLFRNYFARNWPLLSPAHGFVTLAVAMIVLGTDILGNLNNSQLNQDALGQAFWQVAVAAGIIVFVMGWVNLVANFVFRDRSRHVTARQVRAHGAVAVHKTPMPGSSTGSMTYTPTAPELAQTYISSPTTPGGSKISNAFHILTSPRQDHVLPSYYAASPPYNCKDPESPSSKYSRNTNCTKKGVMSVFLGRKRQSLGPPLPVNVSQAPEREMQISGPMGVNPQFAHLVQRPDSALHPSRTGESQTHRWRANS